MINAHVTYKKCPCGQRGCDQYVLSTQRTSGFDQADARLYAAAPGLLQAAQALGGMPEGYCFCSKERDPLKARHEPECRDLRAAIEKALHG